MTRGVDDLDARERSLELGNRLGHHRRVERAGHRKLHRPQSELLGRGARAVERAPIAGQHHLLGRVVVRHRQSVCVRELGRRGRRRRAPSSASIPPSPARSPDSCISLPRSATSSSPSRSLRQPAATSAASSPSEWPAMHVAVGAPERLPAGEARAEDRGLREARALLGARKRVLADDLLDEREQIRADLGHGLAHVRGLAALTWKQDRSYSHSAITLRGERRSGYRPLSGLPPVRGEGRNAPSGVPEAREPPQANTLIRRPRDRRVGRNRQPRSPSCWPRAATISCSSPGARSGSSRSRTS